MKNEMVRLGVGTVDGAYVLSSEDRSTWNKTRPLMKGESVNYMISSPEGRLFASTLSDGIFISDDSRKWTRSSRGLTVNKVWSIEQDAHAPDTVYAGTQYGHLFRSDNSGKSWEALFLSLPLPSALNSQLQSSIIPERSDSQVPPESSDL